jgi:hypothetical protein
MKHSVSILVAMSWILLSGCTQCSRPAAPPKAASEEANRAMDATAPDFGEEGGATDGAETPEDPSWESALEPGMGD